MTPDHARFLAIVLGATLIAVAWCRTFPLGYDRLIWRRFARPLLTACSRLARGLLTSKPRLRVHDRVVCVHVKGIRP